MQQFNSPNVYYLENTEFDPDHRLIIPGLAIVMVQGNYCGYCTQLKPIFQRVADELSQPGLIFATIQIDGAQPGEQVFKTDALSRIIGQPLQGVPLIVKFYDGYPVQSYSGGHSYEELKKWILN